MNTRPKLIAAPSVRLFKYQMKGIPKPIIIAASTRDKARAILANIIAQSPTLQKSEVEGETVERPIRGVTMLRHGGIDYVWEVERDGTQGWKPKLLT